MAMFIARRVGQGVLLLFVMSFLVFVAVYALGDPVTTLINPASPPAVIEQAVRNLGLDQPLHVQYLRFLENALRGELGNSYTSSQPALRLIVQRFPATLELTTAAMVIAAVVGIPLGLVAGYCPDSPLGRLVGGVSIVGISLPTFWIGLMLIIVFAIQLGLLPTGGRGPTVTILGIETSLLSWEGLRHIALPALNLSLFPMAMMVRLTRAGVQENLRTNFVRFARAKGLFARRILLVYVLRSVLIPIVTIMGMVFGELLAFGVVTETVFAWPGIGKLIIEAIRTSDRPVIVAYLLFTVVIFSGINLAADIVCAMIDPRLSLSEAK
ncbi:ABC transporter permease [Mesorhizobium sp. IMUNJ 23232]|uniref:ABC transporter permease n=1 Tax=Mesorhizobium sp. IMUNJ 23232 TaxID=3376064 RepID=UPI0037B7A1A9